MVREYPSFLRRGEFALSRQLLNFLRGKKPVSAFSALTLLLLLFNSSLTVRAAAGELDPTFAGGSITPTLGANYFSASSVAVQPDGKFIVGGLYSTSIFQPFPNAQFALVRFLPTGLIDPNFGNNGRVITSFNEYQASGMSLNDIAVLPDGKIVAVGSGRVPDGSLSRVNLFVVRYNPDGSVDATFNNNGKFTSAAGGTQTAAQSIAVQPDGKFVVAGYGGGAVKGFVPYKFLLFRFSEGGLDKSFGSGGTVLTQIPGGDGQAYSIAVQTDGKIVIGGIASSGTAFGLSLARYDASGSPDSSFGNNGLLIVGGNSLGEAVDVLMQPDGKIVAVGSVNFSNSKDFAVLRFNPDGSPDAGFGTGGKVLTAVSDVSDAALAGALQPDGKIVVAGYSHNYATGSNFKAALVRYNSNGALDTTFGTGGIVSAPAGFSLYDAIVLADGRILAVSGINSTGQENGFRVLRFLGDTPYVPRATPFDFDGDGWADFAVARHEGGGLKWYVTENPSLTNIIETEWGFLSDKLAPADYDGDRKTDLAVFRPSEGKWYIQKSTDNSLRTVILGQLGDVPVPADYDGDGKADPAIFRKGIWEILNSADGSLRTVQFGISTDKPVIGDYDGDGKSDLAFYRGGFWYQFRSSQGVYVERFGAKFDKPVPADYDGDGRTDAAVYRPLVGVWYLLRSTAGYTEVEFGTATDKPVPADYDGDGKADVAVHRADRWFLQQSASGFRVVQFGFASDTPVNGAFLP
jgi:uncharacterized delta-60 repeat protein